MELRMQEPHEKGVAIRSAPSFVLGAVKCPAKRKQGKRWAGYRASKICNQGADAVTTAEGHTTSSGRASCWAALRSRRPHARLETCMSQQRCPPNGFDRSSRVTSTITQYRGTSTACPHFAIG